jgi:curved DNA-binding protein CbpA
MNYYNILGVNPTDTKEQIKKAYRKLALQHHPDKGGNAEKFKKISVAFEILFNDEARRDYDEELRDPSKPRKSKGGLEAPKFDAQETIYKKIDAHREIKEKLEKHNIYFIEDLGAEYLGLFGHDYC